jgi:hypothetical protein
MRDVKRHIARVWLQGINRELWSFYFFSIYHSIYLMDNDLGHDVECKGELRQKDPYFTDSEECRSTGD